MLLQGMQILESYYLTLAFAPHPTESIAGLRFDNATTSPLSLVMHQHKHQYEHAQPGTCHMQPCGSCHQYEHAEPGMCHMQPCGFCHQYEHAEPGMCHEQPCGSCHQYEHAQSGMCCMQPCGSCHQRISQSPASSSAAPLHCTVELAPPQAWRPT